MSELAHKPGLNAATPHRSGVQDLARPLVVAALLAFVAVCVVSAAPGAPPTGELSLPAIAVGLGG